MGVADVTLIFAKALWPAILSIDGCGSLAPHKGGFFVVNFVKAWGRSLSFFDARNVRLLVLGTLVALKSTTLLAALCAIFDVLFWLAFGCRWRGISPSFFPCCTQHAGYAGDLFLWTIHRVIPMTVATLAVRPSVKRKTLWYYVDYGRHVVYVALLAGACVYIAETAGMRNSLLWSLLWPWFSLNLFFFFDGMPSFGNFMKSAGRALTMAAYNAPLYLTIAAVFAIISRFCMWSLGALLALHTFESCKHSVYFGTLGVFAVILSSFFVIFKVCCVSTVYITWLHEQFDMYYVPCKPKDGTS